MTKKHNLNALIYSESVSFLKYPEFSYTDFE